MLGIHIFRGGVRRGLYHALTHCVVGVGGHTTVIRDLA